MSLSFVHVNVFSKFNDYLLIHTFLLRGHFIEVDSTREKLKKYLIQKLFNI